MTQTDGTSLASVTYDSFGQITSGTTPATVDLLFGYTGQVYDGETGLSYYKARYYDPSTGKFLSEDPAASSANLYAYVGNDPMNYIDPTGMVEQQGSWNPHSSLAREYHAERTSRFDALAGICPN